MITQKQAWQTLNELAQKSIAPPTAQDLRMLGALKKAPAEAKQKAAADGVPFIGGKMSSTNKGTQIKGSHTNKGVRSFNIAL